MIKHIYLAGGCFWGLEKYFQNIKGVTYTDVGYANGNTVNPTYDEVCDSLTGHAEAVKVEYDDEIISLKFLLELFYDVIDPTSINKQGNDIGIQYRTGIYYINKNDIYIIEDSLKELTKKYSLPISIEVKELNNYYLAEEYHQKYLDKNKGGYCHIDKNKFEIVKSAVDKSLKYIKKSHQELKENLTDMEYNVTQYGATEPPFRNKYYDNFKEGIYVDITTGEPLFISTDKFESGCGWPSFSKPISEDLIKEVKDESHGMSRIEVRSKNGDSHLGHVFNDGPKERGGFRYCINSASLCFISKDEMQDKGYGEYLKFL